MSPEKPYTVTPNGKLVQYGEDGRIIPPAEFIPEPETHKEAVERLLSSIRAGVWVIATSVIVAAVAGLVFGVIASSTH